MGEIADLEDVVTPDQSATDIDPRRCEIALQLLDKKWLVPILVELEKEPRRRQYLFQTLRISSSRLDPTIQAMTRYGLIERTWIPCGRTDGPGLAITEIGHSFLAALAKLSEWQSTHHSELLANDVNWRSAHSDVQT